MKWIIALIIIIAAAGALWWSGWLEPWIFPQAPVADNTPAPTAQQSQTGLPTADGDSSDAALAQDSAAIDAQLAALENDSASVDGSLNDKPLEQSY